MATFGPNLKVSSPLLVDSVSIFVALSKLTTLPVIMCVAWAAGFLAGAVVVCAA
jgi:hypothetical protein